MKTDELYKKVKNVKTRSAWDKGVQRYALHLVEKLAEYMEYAGVKEVPDKDLEKWLLNGAENWKQYSEGGCALVYNTDIAERLCTPSELKKTKNGLNDPNNRENWVQVQARALFQAWEMIKRTYNEMNK